MTQRSTLPPTLIAALLLILLAPCAVVAATSTQTEAGAADEPALGANLENYDYPWPVSRFLMDTPHGPVSMAYMDVAPDDDIVDPPVAVLLHGKNFCGAYWQDTAKALSDNGYRVIVPDQVGFCKSDKPAAYSYTFHHLAANTQELLEALDIERATIIGHSMGGMLAMRYALMYPQHIDQLVLVDPIGLEDWKAKGVPYRGINAWYAREMKKDYAAIKAYQLKSYYDGDWNDDYARWAKMLAGMYAGPDKATVAWAQAATYDMVYTQPVFYEFEQIDVPTTLMVGTRDKTALGKDLVSDDVRAKLGDYPALARDAVARMPDAELVTFDGIGHLPPIEAPERFKTALFKALKPAGQE
ncbi:alpha/beta fold hydrolase [Salinisphaera aquimarina]|uniref:Alpha/beta fold hydrolase n=1 Tax=Salinisphaera aquimarina TaxID=2094031 RepID=A0ABV7EPG2_9GAMM